MVEFAYGKLREKKLIIFGSGYVGGEVARAGIAAGAQVTALTRNAETAERLRSSGAHVVVAALATDGWHSAIAGGADYVVNTVSSGGAGLEGYRHSYLGGMASIAAWAKRHGPVGTFVYTSSTSVYPQDGGMEVEETASHAGVGERGEVLLAAENALRDLREAGGCARCFVLRLAGIYGPDRHHLLEQVRSGTVAGVGRHRLNLIHRDDVVSAIGAALWAPAEIRDETLNVADDRPARKEEVAAWLAERLGVAVPTFTGLPVGGRRSVTPDRVIVNRKIKRVLGWRPQFPSFREGYENILSRTAE